MMEEEEYQQEGEVGEAGMDEGASSSGTPIAALEVRTRPRAACIAAGADRSHIGVSLTGTERHIGGRREEAD